MNTKDFEKLNSEEKSEFRKALKVFLGYQEDIDNNKEAQREQIAIVAEKTQLPKKYVRKLFSYMKKQVRPEDLAEDAKILEEINGTASA